MKLAFSKPLRLIAFIVAVIFTSETVIQAAPLSASINIAPVPSAAVQIPVPPFMALSPVELPQEMGKVENVFLPEKNVANPFIYLIQDAHESLDAQESIRRILKTLVEKEGADLVCFEGGSLELDRSFYNFTGNPKSNTAVWDALFAKGHIGGLERAALEMNSPARFFGIENEKVYFNNVHKAQKVYLNENKSREVLEQIDGLLSELAGRLLTGDVKKLRDLKRDFDSKRIDLNQYAKELIRNKELNQKEWPYLFRLLKLQELESRIKKNSDAVQHELNQIKKESEKSVVRFVWDSAQHAKVKGRLRWYFERAADELSSKQIHLEKFLNLKDWIGFHVLQDEITSRDLFDEIERFETALFEDMKLSGGQKYFLSLEEDCGLIRNLISLELSRKEWRNILSRKLDIKEVAVKVINFYQETFRKKPQISVLGAVNLIKQFKIARENYALVEQRDKILSAQIIKCIEQVKSQKTAVLAGGFHTDQLADFLKEKKIGFAVISPAIQDVNRKLDYRGRMILGAEKKLLKSRADQTALAVAGSLGSPDAKPFKDRLKLEAKKAMEDSSGSSLGAYQNPRNISIRAKELSQSGQDRKAVNLLEKALAKTANQQDGILWYQLAKSHRILKQFPEALTAIRKAKQLKPNDDRILMLMAEILMGIEDDESLPEALTVIEEALAMYPAIQSLTVKIQILTKLARTQEAIALAERVKKDWPRDLKIYGILSKLYLDVDRPEDAINTVREGLKINPDDVKGYAIEADLWRNRELDEEDISKRIYYLEMAYRAIMNAVTLAPQHPSYLRVKREIEKDLSFLRKLKAKSAAKDDALGASLGAEQTVAKEGDSPNIKYLLSITKFSPGKAAVLPGSIYDSLVTIAGPQALAMLLFEVFQAATGFSEKAKQYEAFNDQVWRFLSASDGQVLLNALNVFAEKRLKRTRVRLQLTDVGEIVSALALPDNERDLVTFAGMQILQSMIFVTLKTGEQIQFYVQIRFTQETYKLADETAVREIPNPLLTSDEGVLDGEKRKFISPAFITPEGAMFRYGITGANAVGFLHVAGYSTADYKRAEEHSQLVRSAQAALFDTLFWKPLESDESAKALILGVGHGRELIRPGVNQKAADIPESLAARILVTDMMEGPLNEIKRRFPKITAVKSDWQKLNVPDESVDIVLGLNAVSFVPKRELPGVIRELDRVLKFSKDGKKKMIFAVDIPPAQLRILTEIQDDGSLSKLKEKLDAVSFLPKWKEIIRQAFLAQGYQVNFRTEITSATVPQNAAHRKLDGANGRRLNAFSFAYDRGIEANFDRFLKSGEVKEVYKVLVVEAVKAQASSLGKGWASGDIVGNRFKIVKTLAVGGYGVLLLADELTPDLQKVVRRVVLKQLARDRRDKSEVLRGEAKFMSQLGAHQNIPKVFDYHEEDANDKFIVMEHIDGDTLSDILDQNPSEPLKAQIEQLIPVAQALEFVHGKGLAHQDVKPANIMIRKDKQPFLIDFGIASQVGSGSDIARSNTLTTALAGGGTLAYMAPEQIRAEKASPTMDIWAFGVMLYEIAAGELPFQTKGRKKLEQVIQEDAPVSPSIIAAKNKRPEIPQDLENLIFKMLEKNPADRPQSMKQVEEALKAIDWTKPARGESRPAVIVPAENKSEDDGLEQILPSDGNLEAVKRLSMGAIIFAVGLGLMGISFSEALPPTLLLSIPGMIIGFAFTVFGASYSVSGIARMKSRESEEAEDEELDDIQEEKDLRHDFKELLTNLKEAVRVGLHHDDDLFEDLGELNELVEDNWGLTGSSDVEWQADLLQLNEKILPKYKQYEDLAKIYEKWFAKARPQTTRDYVTRRLRLAEIYDENLNKSDKALASLRDAELHLREDSNRESLDDLSAKIAIATARINIKEAVREEDAERKRDRAMLAVFASRSALETKTYRVQQYEPRRERLRAAVEVLESGIKTDTHDLIEQTINEDLEYLFSAPGIPKPDAERFYLRGRAKMLQKNPDLAGVLEDFNEALEESSSRHALGRDIRIARAEALYAHAAEADPKNKTEYEKLAELDYEYVLKESGGNKPNVLLQSRVYASRARARAKDRKFAEAVQDYEDAAKQKMIWGKQGDEVGIRLLIRQMEDSDNLVVDAASVAFANLVGGNVIRQELAVPALIKELEGKASRGAVTALSQIGEPAIEALITILDGTRYFVPPTSAVTETLGKMGTKSVFPLIESIKREKNKAALTYKIVALRDAIVASEGKTGLKAALRLLSEIEAEGEEAASEALKTIDEVLNKKEKPAEVAAEPAPLSETESRRLRAIEKAKEAVRIAELHDRERTGEADSHAIIADLQKALDDSKTVAAAVDQPAEPAVAEKEGEVTANAPPALVIEETKPEPAVPAQAIEEAKPEPAKVEPPRPVRPPLKKLIADKKKKENDDDKKDKDGGEQVVLASSLGIVGDDEEGAFDGDGWKPFSAPNQAPDFEQSMEELDAMDERAANMAEDGYWFEAYKIYLQMKKIREFWGMQIPALLTLETGIAQKNLRMLDQAEANLSEALLEIHLWDDSVEDKEFCLYQGLMYRGDLYAQMGRYDDAVRDFSYILALIRMSDASKTAVYEQRAFAYLHLSKWEEARRDFAAIISEDEKEGDDTTIAIYLGLAAALNQLGLVREENRILKEASKFNPDQFSIDFYRALKLTNKRRFAEALRKLKGGLSKITERERIYLHLLKGYAYAERKEYHRALKEFQAVAALDPIHVIAGKNIIQIEAWKESRGTAKPVFAPLSIASPVWFSYFAVDAGAEDEDQDTDTGEADPVIILKEIEDLDHRIFEIEKTLSTFAENCPRSLLLLQADTLFELNAKEKRATGKNKPMYLLQALLAYREVRDQDVSIGKKTTTSFVARRIEEIEKIIEQRDYEGVANFSVNESDSFDGAKIEFLESIPDPDRRLTQISLEIQKQGELPELMLLKASTLLEKFEKIKNPDKKNFRLLAQAEEAFRDLLRAEPDNGFAQKGMVRISEIKAKFFGEGDELGQGAAAKSLGRTGEKYNRIQKEVREFFREHPTLLQDFLTWHYKTTVVPDEINAIIQQRIMAEPGKEASLLALGEQFEVTNESIRQIQKRILEHMLGFIHFEKLKKLASEGKKEEVLNSPVQYMNLNPRSIDSLSRKFSSQDVKIADLTGKTVRQLKSEMKIGKHIIEEIKEKFAMLGLEFKKEEPKPKAEPKEKAKSKKKSEKEELPEIKKFDSAQLIRDKRKQLFALPVTELELSPEALTIVTRIAFYTSNGRKTMNFAELLAVEISDIRSHGGNDGIFEEIRRKRSERMKKANQELTETIEAFRKTEAGKSDEISASSLGEGEGEGFGYYGPEDDPRVVEMEKILEGFVADGKLAKALKQITQIESFLQVHGIKMHPEHYLTRGTIYQEMGRWEISIPPLTEAIERYSSVPMNEEIKEGLGESYLYRGIALMELKRFDEAILDFDKAIAISKEDMKVFEMRGLAHFARAHWKKAITDLAEVISIEKAPLRAYLALAYAYDELDMHHDRDRIVKKMAKNFSYSPKVYFLNALLRYEKKLWKYALKNVNEAIKRQGNKESMPVYLLKGYICLNLQKWDEAEEAFRKAINLDPMNSDARYQLAGILYHKNDWEKANEELNEANFAAGSQFNEASLTRLFQDKNRRLNKVHEFGLPYILEYEEMQEVPQPVMDEIKSIADLFAKHKRIEYEMSVSGVTVPLLLLRAETLTQMFEARKKFSGKESISFLGQASDDYRSVLEMDANNRIAKEELLKLSKMIQDMQNKNKDEGNSGSASSLGVAALPEAKVLDAGQRDALELGVNPDLVRPNLYLDPQGEYPIEDRVLWWQVNHQSGNKRTRQAIVYMLLKNLENIPDRDPKMNKFFRQYFTGYMIESSFKERWYARHQVLHDVFLATLTKDQRDEFMELLRRKKAELNLTPKAGEMVFHMDLYLYEKEDDFDSNVKRLENLSEVFTFLADYYLFPEEGTEKEKANAVHAEFFYPFFEKIKLKVPSRFVLASSMGQPNALQTELANFKDQYGNPLDSVRFVASAAGGILGKLLQIHFPAAYAQLVSESDQSAAQKDTFGNAVTTVVTRDYFEGNGKVLLESLLPKDEIFILVKSASDYQIPDALKQLAAAKKVRVLPVQKKSLNEALGNKQNIFSLEFSLRDSMTVPLLNKEMFRFKWDGSVITDDSGKLGALTKIRKFFLATNPKDRKSLIVQEGITETGGFWFLDRMFLNLIERLTESAQAEKSLQTAA